MARILPAGESAFQLHFNKMHDRYGNVQAVSLVEKNSVEAIVGGLFEKLAGEMDPPKIALEWFDFHKECRCLRTLLIKFSGGMSQKHFKSTGQREVPGERQLFPN